MKRIKKNQFSVNTEHIIIGNVSASKSSNGREIEKVSKRNEERQKEAKNKKKRTKKNLKETKTVIRFDKQMHKP